MAEVCRPVGWWVVVGWGRPAVAGLGTLVVPDRLVAGLAPSESRDFGQFGPLT